MEPVSVGLAVEDSRGVELVNAHETRRVDDTAVTHADAHMDNAALVVLEEGQVVALDVAEADFVAAGDLL